MARKSVSKTKKTPAKIPKDAPARRFRPKRWLRRWIWRFCLFGAALLCALVILFGVIDPPLTPYMYSETKRLGGHDYTWVNMNEIAPVMARSAVAAEDAKFCDHSGFDVEALKSAIEDGGNRGGSTISQQVVKNLFLWQGRSYARKALEAMITPVMEVLWSKRRILEIYLNIIEYDEGVFGIDAAAHHYFGVSPDQLTATQSGRLAAVLPSPKTRSASRPSNYVVQRGKSVAAGAATLAATGRDTCFSG